MDIEDRITPDRVKPPKAYKDLSDDLKREYDDIIEFLRNVRRLSERNYIYAIRYRVVAFMQFLMDNGVTTMRDAKYEHYVEFLQSLGPISIGTYNSYRDGVNKIAEWSYHKGLSNHEVLFRLKMIKTPRMYQKPDALPLSDEEITQIFQNIDKKFYYDFLVIDKIRRGMHTSEKLVRHSMMNVQLKTLVVLLLETGIRIAEAYGLTIDDVDPVNDTILVVRGAKFSKTRQVPYSDFLRSQMKTWLAHRKMVADPDDKSLWLAMFGHRLNDDRVAYPVKYQSFYGWSAYVFGKNNKRMVKGTFKEGAGGWHRFRKTYATRSQRLGLDIAVTSKVLGHSDTATTMRYIGIDKQHVINESKMVEDDRAKMYGKAIVRAKERMKKAQEGDDKAAS